jgi:acetyl/propionyl-CoA carboxylase alpha subunit
MTRNAATQLGSDTAAPARPPLYVAQLPLNEDGLSPIRRVFIANRGEIACRVIATCRLLKITSITIFVEEDSTSRHISDADEAINLGSINQDGGNPFLNRALLVDVARKARADAIHPGYGYLSENAAFANAVREAGMIFVGPSSHAISVLGDKRNSKAYLRKHASKVPLIPGFSGSSQDVYDLEVAAEEIGYPVMLKASAGGGGRGMRIVREKSKLRDDLARATSEAQRSFGSSDCILEKYIEAAKHIEVQILGDRHKNVWSLWERECSVQRRHQKIIEESPSPYLNAAQRKAMCEAAVEIGQLLEYEGAGTVEFVVDAKTGHFFFLEVNTRLQVEHPVTEEVTGLDLVSLQLYVAAAGNLTNISPSGNLPQIGHSIECRLCAEDPAKDFMPEQGIIRLWNPSEKTLRSRDVRFETSVQSGSSVSIYFDSMIAKIIVWAPTRPMAIRKMVKTLSDTVCAGVRTNQQFLQSCLLHKSFQDPAYTTSLISTHLESLLQNAHFQNLVFSPLQLAVIPAAFLRRQQSQSTTRPFKHVRLGFRNQMFDSTNVNAMLITTADPSASSTPVLVLPISEYGQSRYSMAPLPELEKSVESDQKDQSAALILSTRYKVVSDRLRGDKQSTATQYEIKFGKCMEINIESDARKTWTAYDADVFINDSKVRTCIATDTNVNKPDMSGGFQTVMCHFPDIGTWIEYRCFTLLGYFESLRETVEGATENASNSVKAPMPCKVLSVLKRNGDEVKKGDTVMVIESMKMETNVTIGVGGRFMTNVKQGSSVGDGEVLCWVE